ncbi:6,7-dimethyl-8-ribityllumazine synthase [Alphaproteobacteria bacterium]
MAKVLIIEACFYRGTVKSSLNVAKTILEAADIAFDYFLVPGIFEIPNALNIILEAQDYDGVIILGCIVKEETEYYDMILRECARGINDTAMNYAIPLGFGITVVHNTLQAESLSDEHAKRAVEVCIELMHLKEKFANFEMSHQDFACIKH